MSIFTMINPSSKEIGEDKEFDNYILADKYCKENYGEGWIAKYEPFHFTSDFYKFLLDGTHESIKTNNRGKAVALIIDNTVVHCNMITFGEWATFKHHGIKAKQITKREFIELHNELIRSTYN